LGRVKFTLINRKSRFKEVSDGVKVDVLFNNYHYLAKVNNEGKIVDNVIVPDVSVYAGTEKGYNKKRRCLIVREGDAIKVIDANLSNNSLP
jgi:hypothetical protein